METTQLINSASAQSNAYKAAQSKVVAVQPPAAIHNSEAISMLVDASVGKIALEVHKHKLPLVKFSISSIALLIIIFLGCFFYVVRNTFRLYYAGE